MLNHVEVKAKLSEKVAKFGSSEMQQPTNGTESVKPLFAELENYVFKASNKVEVPEAILSIDGHIISTPGYITTIVGQSKSGKSGVTNSLIGGAMFSGEDYDGCGVSIKPNKENKLLLHIDTEQNSYNHHKSLQTALQRANLKTEPEWLKSYRLSTLNIKDKIESIEFLLEVYSLKFGGVHSIFLDGIADLTSSVNNEAECNEIVQRMEDLARKYYCPLICIIHLNPSAISDKGRGHLDSQLQRKSESYIKITKDKESGFSTIEPLLLRNAGNVPNVQFTFDTDKGYHVYCGVAKSKFEQKKEVLYNLASLVFEDGKLTLRAKEIIERIETIKEVKTRQAEKIKSDMEKEGIVTSFLDTGGVKKHSLNKLKIDDTVIPSSTVILPF